MIKRKSAALLITLSFLIFFSVMANIMMGKINDYFVYERSKSNYIHIDYSIKNISNILKKVPNDYLEDLTVLPINGSNDNFTFILSLNDDQNLLNLNWYKNKNSKEFLIKSLTNHLNEKNLLYSDVFFNLLDDVYKTKKTGRNFLTFNNDKLSRKHIYNFNHFKYLLDSYFEVTNDSQIYNIQWDEILSFNNKGIYLNTLNENMFNFFFFEDKNKYQEFKDIEDKKKYIKDNLMGGGKFVNSIIINKEKEYYSADLSLVLNNVEYQIDFLYNVSNKKIENIRFE